MSVIAKNRQEAAQATKQMYDFLKSLDVQELKTFGNVTQPAQSFAEAVMLEIHPDKIKRLCQEQPEQASAFLTMLGDAHAELSLGLELPAVQTAEIPKMHMLAAEAVLFLIETRRNRRKPGARQSLVSYY
jgi:hypothetical protein